MDGRLSTYRADSELSRFNRSRKTDWIPASEEFVKVLREALSISDRSGGAFDVTVGPLVNLWGFGPERRRGLVPSQEEIEARKKLVGYRKLHVRTSPSSVKKDIPELYCDLSAIAKGYAVDKAAEYLEGEGFEDYMVEVGGEVRAKGRNQNGDPWRIGVQRPDTAGSLEKIVSISDAGVATSGDYLNYFEVDGVRYSHTIDPRTGRPITHSLASVTVIHPSCMTADGMATAINVLGPDEGYAFAVREKLAVLMIVRGKDSFVEKMTPSFRRFLLSGGR